MSNKQDNENLDNSNNNQEESKNNYNSHKEYSSNKFSEDFTSSELNRSDGDLNSFDDNDISTKKSFFSFMSRSKSSSSVFSKLVSKLNKDSSSKLNSKENNSYSFFSTHPVVRVDNNLPPTFISRFFTVLSFGTLIVLTLIVVLQTVFSLDARALWYSDEIRHADAFYSFLHSNNWFLLNMNGDVYPDKPSGYFILLRFLYQAVESFLPHKLSVEFVFFLGTAISGLIYVWSMYFLGAFVARVEHKILLASGLILLSMGYFFGLLHYARMDLLFSSLIIFSSICFYHAVIRDKSYLFSVLGFCIAILACFVKGPLGIILPLAVGIAFCVWTCRAKRLIKVDLLIGFLVALVLVALWAVALYLESGSLSLLYEDILKKQVVQRGVESFHHKESWHYYFARLPFVFLPWTFLILVMPWYKISFKSIKSAYINSKSNSQEGITFLWCMVIVPLILLSMVSGKIHIYYLPSVAAVAILMGRSVMKFSARQNKTLRILIGVFFCFASFATVVFTLMLFGFLAIPSWLPGWSLEQNSAFLLVAAILLIAGAVLLFACKGGRIESVLFVLTFFTVAISYPITSMVAHSFDDVLSPKKQALVLKSYIDKGYKPFSYKVYGGTYSFYSNNVITPVKELSDIEQIANANQPVVLVTREKSYNSWINEPVIGYNGEVSEAWLNAVNCFKVVDTQYIETRKYVVAVCPLDYDANKDLLNNKENSTTEEHYSEHITTEVNNGSAATSNDVNDEELSTKSSSNDLNTVNKTNANELDAITKANDTEPSTSSGKDNNEANTAKVNDNELKSSSITRNSTLVDTNSEEVSSPINTTNFSEGSVIIDNTNKVFNDFYSNSTSKNNTASGSSLTKHDDNIINNNTKTLDNSNSTVIRNTRNNTLIED